MPSVTREDLVKLAREAVAKTRYDDHRFNPMKFDPPEWVLEAMRAAWRAGYRACASYPLTTDSENTGRG